MANVNIYGGKDKMNRAVDNEIEYLLRAYVDYYAGSELALSRKEVLDVFIKRLMLKMKRGAAQEPQNLRARITQTGFAQAH